MSSTAGIASARITSRLLVFAALALVAGCDVEDDDAREDRPRRGGDDTRRERGGREDGGGARGDRSAPGGHRFPGPSRASRARVTGVTDGDTISLSGVGKVRLIGVDTPEVYGGVECYGRQASAFTERTLGRSERVQYRLGVEERDRYGRALAYVWLDDGRMLNGLLVERGFALPLTIPPNVDYSERFVAAGRRARRREAGLWAESACGGDPREHTRYCSDFQTQEEAQRWFEREGRVDDADGDGDGVVCETLP